MITPNSKKYARLIVCCTLAFSLVESKAAFAEELTLQQIVERALKNSPLLKKARSQKRAAEVESDLALGAFAPTVQLSGSYLRLSEEEYPELAPGVTFPQFLDSYSFSGSMVLPVTEYLVTKPALFAIAKLGLDLSEAQLSEQREAVAEHAATQALRLHAARRSQEAIQTGLETLRLQVVDVKRLVDAGATTKSALLATEAQVANVETQLIRIEGALRLLSLELALLIGWPSDQDFPKIEVELSEQQLPSFDAAVNVAIGSRPELRALKFAAKLKEKEVRLYSSGRFPALSVAGSIESANPNNRIFPPTGDLDTTWAVQAQLSWSPNVFLAQTVKYGRALEELEGLSADLEGLENVVKTQIAAALSEWETAGRLQQANGKRVNAAQLALQEQQTLTRIGEATIQNLLDREQAYREARLSFIDAKIQRKIAEIKTRRALGELTRSNSNTGASP